MKKRQKQPPSRKRLYQKSTGKDLIKVPRTNYQYKKFKQQRLNSNIFIFSRDLEPYGRTPSSTTHVKWIYFLREMERDLGFKPRSHDFRELYNRGVFWSDDPMVLFRTCWSNTDEGREGLVYWFIGDRSAARSNIVDASKNHVYATKAPLHKRGKYVDFSGSCVFSSICTDLGLDKRFWMC